MLQKASPLPTCDECGRLIYCVQEWGYVGPRNQMRDQPFVIICHGCWRLVKELSGIDPCRGNVIR